MQEILKEKQRIRLTALNKIYEISDGNVDEYINGEDLIKACEISADQLKMAADYLEGEALIEVKRVSGGLPALIRIRHPGVIEVEQAFQKPDQPTTHFPPMNILFVNQMIGSSVQQGTVNSTQNSSIALSGSAIEALKKFVDDAAQALEVTDKENSHFQEMKSEVETLKAQVSSPKPKKSIIQECLHSLRNLCENAAAGAIGNQLATYIPALLVWFKS